eukprot:1628942-Alexandrium_andersonii.AAC.1
MVITARLDYVNKVLGAGSTYMGLGPTGLAPDDSAILTAHMLHKRVDVLHEIATTPTALAKHM